MKVNSIISAGWIIPVEPDSQVLENHSIVIKDGIIESILPTEQAKQDYQTGEQIDLKNHIIMPGLINAHTHVGMSLLRGAADDLPLMTWLQEHIWPLEQRWVGEEFVADGTRLAMIEMIRSGTTCFNDMYFFPEVTAREVQKSGMRASIGLILIDFPSAWAKDSDEYLNKGLALAEQLESESLISTCFAPHAPYTVGNASLTKIRDWSDRLDKPIHMHIHETADEVQQNQSEFAMRPLARLDDLGLLNKRLNAVHMTQLDDSEIERLQQTQSNVIHSPHSNLKLASGFCPIGKLTKAGVNVALGTDSSASNNSLDMLAEMKTAALLAKAVNQDASAVPAASALKMATLNGAKALGIDKITGSLKKGKSADMIAINVDQPEMQPLLNPISQVVYASSRDQVDYVWVNGKCLLKDRQLTTLDQYEIMDKSKAWQAKLR